MEIDFKPFFGKYDALVTTADETFEKVRKTYPESVKCKIKCADCCYALFDLSLIEAIYINYRFHEIFAGTEKDKILEKANRLDRKIYKIKRNAYKEFESGKQEAAILDEMAKEKVRCPLLNDQEQCDLYTFRPITCRIYGIPTDIAGVGRTCGKSGFIEGKRYPTVHLDIIHRRLYDISAELTATIESQHVKIAEILMPLSMALLTEFNAEYLGIAGHHSPESDKESENE